MKSSSKWGIFFILIGIILLLFSYEIVTISEWWKAWPFIIVLIGVIMIFHNDSKIEEVKQ